MTIIIIIDFFIIILSQSGRHVPPIRTIRSARTLRSSKWRTYEMYELLGKHNVLCDLVMNELYRVISGYY